jgi:hypothetical protein
MARNAEIVMKTAELIFQTLIPTLIIGSNNLFRRISENVR